MRADRSLEGGGVSKQSPRWASYIVIVRSGGEFDGVEGDGTTLKRDFIVPFETDVHDVEVRNVLRRSLHRVDLSVCVLRRVEHLVRLWVHDLRVGGEGGVVHSSYYLKLDTEIGENPALVPVPAHIRVVDEVPLHPDRHVRLRGDALSSSKEGGWLKQRSRTILPPSYIGSRTAETDARLETPDHHAVIDCLFDVERAWHPLPFALIFAAGGGGRHNKFITSVCKIKTRLT